MPENNRLPHSHHSKEEEKRILGILPDDEQVYAVAEAMKQLGDPSRLRIFWLLCHTEECVINIAALVKMSSPAVSHHLRLLKAAGLIVSKREGKEMYYRASKTTLVSRLHGTIAAIAEGSCPDER